MLVSSRAFRTYTNLVALVKRLRAKLNHLQSLSPEFGVYEYSTGEKFAGRI